MGTNNENLPLLLRAIAGGTDARKSRHDVIFNAAADKIERLEADVDLWKDRWESERRDHETTMKQADDIVNGE